MWKALKGQRLALGIMGILLLELPFKFMHWPGADALGIISFPFLLIHQFRFFFVANKESSFWIRVVGFLAFIGLWTGLIFLLKHFLPTSQAFYIVSGSAAGILLYVVLITLSDKKPAYRRLDLLIHVFVVLSLFKVITRQNGINYTQSLAQSAYFTALDELAAYENQNDSMLTALKVSNPDPALSIYLDMRSTDELISHIAYTKKLLAEQLTHDFFTDPDSLMLAPEYASNYTTPTALFVLSLSNEPADAALEDYQTKVLQDKIEKWRKTRLYRISQVDDYVNSSLLNTADFTYAYANGVEDTLAWHQALFYNIPSIGFMDNLNKIMRDLEKVKALQLLHFNAEDEALFNYIYQTSFKSEVREKELDGLVAKLNKADAFTSQSYLILWAIALYFMLLLALVKRLPASWIKGGIFFFFILLFELFFLELEPLLSFYFPGDLLPIYSINFILAAALVPVHQYFQDLFLKTFRNE